MHVSPSPEEEQQKSVAVLTALVEAETIISLSVHMTSLIFWAGTQLTALSVCVFAILVWDWAITLHMEIRYVWKSKWTLGKVLYLFTRYIAVVDIFLGLFWLRLRNIPDKQTECPVPFTARAWFGCVGIEIAELILVLRTWALWGRNRWILAILLVLQSIVFAYDGFSLYFFVKSVTWGGPELAEVPGCVLVGASRTQLFSGSLISIAAFEFIIFIFTLIFVLRKARRNRLTDIIFRDGVTFSLAMTLISVVNVVIMNVVPPEYSNILLLFQCVMHSIATSRILLHMREGANIDAIISSTSHPGVSIQFNTSGIQSNAWQEHSSPNASAMAVISMTDTIGRRVFNDDISMWFGEEEGIEDQIPTTHVGKLVD